MKSLLFFILAPLSWGQFTVMFTPWSPGMTTQVFGNGKDAGVYKVSVCSDATAPLVIPAERILMAAPDVKAMPTAVAEDLLNRKAGASKWALVARYFGFALQYGGMGVTSYGVVAKVPAATNVGVAIQGAFALANLLTSRAEARAPNPAPYYAMLLPETIVLATAASCGSFLVVSGIVKDAKVIGPIAVPPPAVPAKSSEACRETACSEVLAAVWR